MIALMEHDTLAKRLGLILTRLNTGERLNLSSLAREFNVTQRTLQRDFNERLAYLPIEREGSTYYLNPQYLGRQGRMDIKSTLDTLGLSDMFPSFDALSFSRLHTNGLSPFLFKNIRIEDTATLEEAFKLLTLAIQNCNKVSFTMKNLKYVETCPYRLVNDRGYWYLAATHDKILKMFKIADLIDINVSNKTFERSKEHEKKLTHSNQFLLTDTPIELVLKVNASIVNSFIEREELPQQNILKILDDGSILISSTVAEPKRVLPILRYWLPELEILSPSDIKQQLIHDLEYTLEKISNII